MKAEQTPKCVLSKQKIKNMYVLILLLNPLVYKKSFLCVCGGGGEGGGGVSVDFLFRKLKETLEMRFCLIFTQPA